MQAQQAPSAVSITKTDSTLILTYKNKPVLAYFYGFKKAPTSVDSLYGRSGFIHPIYSPFGDELTQIQPADHYHHYGLWNPWTHTAYDGDTIDFWNLKKGQGTVRFAGFTQDQPQNGFKAKHEHVILKGAHAGFVVLNETQTVLLNAINDSVFQLDFEINYKVNGNKPFTLLEYRYGGFTWRVTELWNQNNCDVLTSAGHTRNSADGSLAGWFLIQGNLPDGYAGGLIMSHPKNYNHPQPLRIWPERKPPSEIMANFSPTKNKDWVLQTNQTYVLKYRMIIYSGKFDKAKAQQYWLNYSR